MGAGATGTAFGGKQESAGGNQGEPATGADAFELGALVGIEVPHAVIVVTEEQRVAGGGHSAAAATFGQILPDGLTCGEVEGALIGVEDVVDDDGMLEVTAMVALVFLVAFGPKELAASGKRFDVPWF